MIGAVRGAFPGRTASLAVAALSLAGVTRCSTVVPVGALEGGVGGSTTASATAGPGGASGIGESSVVTTGVSGTGGSSESSCGVTTLTSLFNGPANLALQGDTIYWKPNDPTGTILDVSLEGGPVQTVVPGSMFSVTAPIAVTATSLFWASAGLWTSSLPGGVPSLYLDAPGLDGFGVADAEGFYLVDGGASLVSAPLDEGGGDAGIPEAGVPALTTLFTGKAPIIALTQDADNLYWVDATSVHAVPKAGGGSTLLATGSDILGIAIDDASVYWADAHAGTGSSPGMLLAVAKTGGTPATIVSGLRLPDAVGTFGATGGLALAVDATSIYWWDETPGLNRLVLGGESIEVVSPDDSIDMLILCPPGVCWTHSEATVSSPYWPGSLRRFAPCP